MTASANSSTYTSAPGARTSATPSSRPPPDSVGQAMPPLLSPRREPLQAAGSRTPSPNYFGFSTLDESFDSDTNSNQHMRKNWSPPSSTVRSTAAFSPTVVPVDQNPDFDAFRRQSEGKVFSLGNLHTFKQPPPPRASHGRSQSRQSGQEAQKPAMQASEPRATGPPAARSSSTNTMLDPDSAFMGRSPKRHLSNDSATFPDAIRRVSPPSLTGAESAMASVERGMPRLSMPPELKLPTFGRTKVRAETAPTIAEDEKSPLVTPQHVINLVESAPDEILILDLRVSTHYAHAKITGALNLCIPTTLLKRPSFNVQKLAETFKDGSDERLKFESWKTTKYLIVYDAASSQLKDATTCLNTLKKFRSEGYNGALYAIKGGYAEFATKFPNYVESAVLAGPVGSPLKLDLNGPEVAPVVGGCPMPVTKSAANPFFGNIRQNMDLIGGVGQMPVKLPASMTQHAEARLPSWLRAASAQSDKGACVSEKFLQIEKREQKRMQDALSGQVSYGSPTRDKPNTVQIAGIEKGSKNRYNNIWPYEHTRVKLQDVPSHACDYVNASHVVTKRSNKKYIATQGPIPATFTDFWNVVWQQDVRVIVMLTAEKEGGQVKAHNYWSDKQYGPMRLEFLSEKRASLDPLKIKRHRQRPPMKGTKSSDAPPLARLDTATANETDQPYVIVRKLALSHEGYPFERMREVTQLQYSSWPDFGAPAHPAHLLGLVEQCDAVVRRTTAATHNEPDPESSRPVLVHCSAGCGRTGTFCTVDSVIDMLKRQRASRRAARERGGSPMQIDRRRSQTQVDSSSFFNSGSFAQYPDTDEGVEGSWVTKEDQDLIEKTVEDFRHQRISMVQSLRQFVLCYESVMEWLVEQDQEEEED